MGLFDCLGGGGSARALAPSSSASSRLPPHSSLHLDAIATPLGKALDDAGVRPSSTADPDSSASDAVVILQLMGQDVVGAVGTASFSLGQKGAAQQREALPRVICALQMHADCGPSFEVPMHMGSAVRACPVAANDAAYTAWGIRDLGALAQRLSALAQAHASLLSCLGRVARFSSTPLDSAPSTSCWVPSASCSMPGGTCIRVLSSFLRNPEDGTLSPALVLEGAPPAPTDSFRAPPFGPVTHQPAAQLADPPRSSDAPISPVGTVSLPDPRRSPAPPRRAASGSRMMRSSREASASASGARERKAAERERRELLRARAMLDAIPCMATLLELNVTAPDAGPCEGSPQTAGSSDGTAAGSSGRQLPDQGGVNAADVGGSAVAGPSGRLAIGRVLMQNERSQAHWGRLSTQDPTGASTLLEVLFKEEPDAIQEMVQQLQVQAQLSDPEQQQDSWWKKVVQIPLASAWIQRQRSAGLAIAAAGPSAGGRGGAAGSSAARGTTGPKAPVRMSTDADAAAAASAWPETSSRTSHQTGLSDPLSPLHAGPDHQPSPRSSGLSITSSLSAQRWSPSGSVRRVGAGAAAQPQPGGSHVRTTASPPEPQGAEEGLLSEHDLQNAHFYDTFPDDTSLRNEASYEAYDMPSVGGANGLGPERLSFMRVSASHGGSAAAAGPVSMVRNSQPSTPLSDAARLHSQRTASATTNLLTGSRTSLSFPQLPETGATPSVSSRVLKLSLLTAHSGGSGGSGGPTSADFRPRSHVDFQGTASPSSVQARRFASMDLRDTGGHRRLQTHASGPRPPHHRAETAGPTGEEFSIERHMPEGLALFNNLGPGQLVAQKSWPRGQLTELSKELTTSFTSGDKQSAEGAHRAAARERSSPDLPRRAGQQQQQQQQQLRHRPSSSPSNAPGRPRVGTAVRAEPRQRDQAVSPPRPSASSSAPLPAPRKGCHLHLPPPVQQPYTTAELSSDSEPSRPASVVNEEHEAEEEGAEQEMMTCEVTALLVRDRVTGKQAVLLLQADITARALLEKRMSALTETQLTMLENMLPRQVLEYAIGGSGPIGSLAYQHEEVTVMFCDIVGFTSMSKEVAPQTVMSFLNALFSQLDEMCELFDIYKVDTAGDCYIVAGALTKVDEDGFIALDEDADPRQGARNVVSFAQELMQYVKTVYMPHDGRPTTVRVGVHTGSLVSGLVGTKMFKFSVYGDTMNTSSRMESTSKPGCIQVSKATYDILDEDQQALFRPTGGVEVKGKGLMATYIHEPSGHAFVSRRADTSLAAIDEETAPSSGTLDGNRMSDASARSQELELRGVSRHSLLAHSERSPVQPDTSAGSPPKSGVAAAPDRAWDRRRSVDASLSSSPQRLGQPLSLPVPARARRSSCTEGGARRSIEHRPLFADMVRAAAAVMEQQQQQHSPQQQPDGALAKLFKGI